MKTINLTTNSFTASPYPMQQLTNQKTKVINYVDTEAPEVGDTLKFIAGQSNFPEVIVSEVLDARKPSGNHANDRAMFYSVRYA